MEVIIHDRVQLTRSLNSCCIISSHWASTRRCQWRC